MKRYGLIGYPLGHSFSQRYFTEKFEREGIAGCTYENFPIESIDRLDEVLERHPDLCGFNVTIPYKERIIPRLRSMAEEARKIGAVNCIRVTPEGLVGHNTDAYGFRTSLLKLLDGTHPERALVLGTGGASKAVKYVLEQLGIPFDVVSRKASAGNFTYDELTSETCPHPSPDRQCDSAGHFPQDGRMSGYSLRGNRRNAFSVRSGLQPAPHRVPSPGTTAGCRHRQRIRHAGGTGRKGLVDLERQRITTTRTGDTEPAARQERIFLSSAESSISHTAQLRTFVIADTLPVVTADSRFCKSPKVSTRVAVWPRTISEKAEKCTGPAHRAINDPPKRLTLPDIPFVGNGPRPFTGIRPKSEPGIRRQSFRAVRKRPVAIRSPAAVPTDRRASRKDRPVLCGEHGPVFHSVNIP